MDAESLNWYLEFQNRTNLTWCRWIAYFSRHWFSILVSDLLSKFNPSTFPESLISSFQSKIKLKEISPNLFCFHSFFSYFFAFINNLICFLILIALLCSWNLLLIIIECLNKSESCRESIPRKSMLWAIFKARILKKCYLHFISLFSLLYSKISEQPKGTKGGKGVGFNYQNQ